jgi:hypothetical protein
MCDVLLTSIFGDRGVEEGRFKGLNAEIALDAKLISDARAKSKDRSTAMSQAHQPGEAVFRSILPEEIEWKPFAGFPPTARLAVVVGEPTKPGPT